MQNKTIYHLVQLILWGNLLSKRVEERNPLAENLKLLSMPTTRIFKAGSITSTMIANIGNDYK